MGVNLNKQTALSPIRAALSEMVANLAKNNERGDCGTIRVIPGGSDQVTIWIGNSALHLKEHSVLKGRYLVTYQADPEHMPELLEGNLTVDYQTMEYDRARGRYVIHEGVLPILTGGTGPTWEGLQDPVIFVSTKDIPRGKESPFESLSGDNYCEWDIFYNGAHLCEVEYDETFDTEDDPCKGWGESNYHMSFGGLNGSGKQHIVGRQVGQISAIHVMPSNPQHNGYYSYAPR